MRLILAFFKIIDSLESLHLLILCNSVLKIPNSDTCLWNADNTYFTSSAQFSGCYEVIHWKCFSNC